ncbi:DUF4144 domain-containing protein [Vibrio sp. 99-70-13A1]|uniref:DUF4144 domain-containing protein n=1 Tax=Vibrio sp. 99-70-13A1 TaxID=2607601 RepID=UPI001493D42A|nr:DUF4144 domain-containing protein [Vibrio sp. 99-70-13A1]NOH98712.1 hypothetical protein [Vibrio sp. 99-70-13A1]
MISWPCILKLDGDNELMFFQNEQAFISECQDLILDDNDYAVDSEGACYTIGSSANQPILADTGKRLNVQDVTVLIQEHEFSKAEMCIIKIHFPTVSEAINSLAFEYNL